MKCIQCGIELKKSDNFCPECGKNQKQLKAGDIIEFGEWEGKPISWIVLSVNKREERALLLSEYALEQRKYNEVRKRITWEHSSIRFYLNGEFIKKAFNFNEMRRLVPVRNHNAKNPEYGTEGGSPTWDKVFLLSIEEFELHFKQENLRAYAACKSFSKKVINKIFNKKDYVWWWLRSPGCDANGAAGVRSDGSIDHCGNYVIIVYVWVRPALYYNLKSGISENL